MQQVKRLEVEQNNLERAIYWVGNSDTKVQIVLAFLAALPAVLVSKANDLRVLVMTGSLFASWLIIFAVLVHFYFLSMCLYFAFRTIFPDVKPRKATSLLFFGSIASMTNNQFSKEMRTVTLDGIESDLNEQTHTISSIALKKFKNVSNALQSLLLALTAWLLIFLVWTISSFL